MDSLFRLSDCRADALLITSCASRDKCLEDEADENWLVLFELVGFLLSDRLTSAKAQREDGVQRIARIGERAFRLGRRYPGRAVPFAKSKDSRRIWIIRFLWSV